MKYVRGSVSVFLALTVTLALSFCMVLIESARENTMLLKADVIYDTGVQSLLAEYHNRLWEDYDVLYLDCSYGTQVPNYELVKTHLRGYVDKNLSYDNYGWLALECTDMHLTDVLLATDYSGTDFYLQAVEAAEESIGITYIEQALQWLEQAEAVSDMEAYINQELSQTQQAIDDVNGTEVEVKEAVWGVDKNGEPILLEEAEYETVDIDNPLDNISVGKLLLGQILGDAEISEVRVDTGMLVSNRTLAAGSKTGSTEDAGGVWNKALFCKYILDHFPCYMDGTDMVQSIDFRCQLEYIIGGKSSDAANLEVVIGKLLLLREIDNYLCLLQDEARNAEAEVIGTAAATAAYVPWLSPVIKQAILLYWAYEDSVEDLQQLFQGKEIPLVKSLGVEVVSEFSLNYKDYLMLLLVLQQKDTLTMRTMDMIELSIREEQSDFRMDGCIGHGVLTGTFEDTYDKTYIITKQLQY